MTVLTTDSEIVFLGNGGATNFPYTFLIPDEDSIRVYYQANATAAYEDVTADCTFTPFNNPLGGEVTYLRDASPIPVGSQLSIVRRVPNTQEITVTNQTRYDASVAMKVWDRLTMQIQDLVEGQKRTPRFGYGTDYESVLIADMADGQALIWDEESSSFVPGPDAADIAVAQTYATAADAAADRAEAAAAAAAAAAQVLFIDTLDDLLADTDFTYTAAQPKTVVAGNTIMTIREGFAFEVLASGAGSQHHTTAGGVKLNVREQDGKVNLKAFNVDALGGTSVSSALQAANDLLAAGGKGGTIVIPTGVYLVSTKVNLSSEICVRGERDVILRQGTNNITMLEANAVSYVRIEGLRFRNPSNFTDGNAIRFTTADKCIVTDCDFFDMPSTSNGTVRVSASTNCRIEANWFDASAGNAMCLIGTGGDRNHVLNNYVNNCGGFGLFVAGNSSYNYISGNRCLTNGIELVGVAVGSNHNIIIGNHAEGCGDNGISVTGNYNVVSNNICRANDLSGIHLYGSFNVAVGNICTRNGQSAATRAGIAIQAAFGGSGQGNLVSGNIFDDDQPVPTQNNGLRVLAPSYTQWASGQSITAGDYRFNGIRIYLAATSGTTGATAPTHTSGDASDGGVTWTYRNFVRSAVDQRITRAGPNVHGISVTADILDQTDPGYAPLNLSQGGHEFFSSVAFNYTQKESSYAIGRDDHIVSVRTTSSFTITLPASTDMRVGRQIIIKDETGTANVNNITVNGNGNNIEGSATATISTSYGQLRLYYSGIQWLRW